jgi:hypothetical protein
MSLKRGVATSSELTESTAGSIRLEGFNFVQGTGVHSAPNAVILKNLRDGGKPILITRNNYKAGGTGDFIIDLTNRGVVWANSMSAALGGSGCLNNAAFLRHRPASLSSSWTTAPTYGTADRTGESNLYIENNTLFNVFEGIDVDVNARTVIRFNTITNSGTINHGVDTGDIGGRFIEMYKNTLVWDTTIQCGADLPAGVNSFFYLRGGPAMFHNNIVPDLKSQAWNDKPEIGFAVAALRRNAGSYGCWKGGYPMVHQVGWGYSRGGTKAATTSVRQDLEPVYMWGNTGGGNYGNPALANYPGDECGTTETTADYVKVNRVQTCPRGRRRYIKYFSLKDFGCGNRSGQRGDLDYRGWSAETSVFESRCSHLHRHSSRGTFDNAGLGVLFLHGTFNGVRLRRITSRKIAVMPCGAKVVWFRISSRLKRQHVISRPSKLPSLHARLKLPQLNECVKLIHILDRRRYILEIISARLDAYSLAVIKPASYISFRALSR